ncbi:MAG: hypothetical protein ACYC92_10170 [Candidatus Acidiferrales bacterium]
MIDEQGVQGPLKSASPGSVSPKPKQGTKKNKSKKVAPSRKAGHRKARSFPASTFEEALALAAAIQQFASGQRVRRLTLFDNLKKSPDSGPSRQLVTNSSKYGLTAGGYQAEHLELTPDGALATSPEAPPRDQLRARFKLAIENIPPFKSLYDRFKGNKMPAQAVLRDHLADAGFSSDEISECVDTFILNAKFLGLLRTVAGAERLLPIEHLLEDLPSSGASSITQIQVNGLGQPLEAVLGAHDAGEADWLKICFYLTPIGEPDSDQRKHSNLFLSSIIEPAVDEFGLRVIRADSIGKPGMITAQIIQHVIRARLVIADLSFHNPNVFYELSLRHACRLPTVQVIRASDRIPFDLDQFRTVKIDTGSIYTLVPSLETYKAEIANQVRRALSDPDAVDNPVSLFCPGLRVQLPPNGAKQ